MVGKLKKLGGKLVFLLVGFRMVGVSDGWFYFWQFLVSSRCSGWLVLFLAILRRDLFGMVSLRDPIQRLYK